MLRTLTDIATSPLYRNPGRFVSGLTAFVPNAVFKSPYLMTAGGRHLLASFALMSYSLSLSHTASICPTVVFTVVSTTVKTSSLLHPSHTSGSVAASTAHGRCSGAVCQRDGGHRMGAGSTMARQILNLNTRTQQSITTVFTHRCRKFHHLSGA